MGRGGGMGLQRALTATPPRSVMPQPLEVLRVGMQREFMVVENEDDYGQVILSLAATEVRNRPESARGSA